MMGIAENVGAVLVAEIWLPMIMTRKAGKLRKHSRRINPFFAPLLMGAVENSHSNGSGIP